MLDAAVKAISQILSPPMRTILWRSIGLALVLVAVLAIGLQRALSWFAESGEVWAEAWPASELITAKPMCRAFERGPPPPTPPVAVTTLPSRPPLAW